MLCMQRNKNGICLNISRIASTTRTNCLFFVLFKYLKSAILFLSIIFALQSCAVRRGCPSDGANVGAEKIISGDPQAAKAIKHGKKFNINKF